MNKLSFQNESLLEKNALTKHESTHLYGGGPCAGDFCGGGNIRINVGNGIKQEKYKKESLEQR